MVCFRTLKWGNSIRRKLFWLTSAIPLTTAGCLESLLSWRISSLSSKSFTSYIIITHNGCCHGVKQVDLTSRQTYAHICMCVILSLKKKVAKLSQIRKLQMCIIAGILSHKCHILLKQRISLHVQMKKLSKLSIMWPKNI